MVLVPKQFYTVFNKISNLRFAIYGTSRLEDVLLPTIHAMALPHPEHIYIPG